MILNTGFWLLDLIFEHSDFEFVSVFVLRYSDLKGYVTGYDSFKDNKISAHSTYE
jgi:hypothetical protein